MRKWIESLARVGFRALKVETRCRLRIDVKCLNYLCVLFEEIFIWHYLVFTHLFVIDAINEHLVICFVKLQTKHLHVLFIMSLGKFEWLTFSFGFPVSK